MKVWVCLYTSGDETVFMGLAKTMDKAKTFGGTDRKWEDYPNGKESRAIVDRYDEYRVFEEDVIE